MLFHSTEFLFYFLPAALLLHRLALIGSVKSYSSLARLCLLVATLVFGMMTSVQAKGLATGDPTPWIGITERLCIGAFLAWVGALAIALLRSPRTSVGLTAHEQEAARG